MGSERVYSRAVRRAIERERLRREAVDAINRLTPAEFTTWAEGASRLNEVAVRNELGRSWTAGSLSSFVEIQMLALGVRFSERLRLDDRRSAGGRVGAVKRWESRSPLEEVRNACAAARTREEAADILNREGVKTGLGKPWTSSRVGDFLKRHRANVVEVLEDIEPDRSLTWEIIADRLNLLGARNMNGGAWTGNNLRHLVRKENRNRKVPLLSWLPGRKASGERQRNYRNALAEKVGEICGEFDRYGAAAKALNDADVKTLAGNAWTAERLSNFAKSYRRATGKDLIRRKGMKVSADRDIVGRDAAKGRADDQTSDRASGGERESVDG